MARMRPLTQVTIGALTVWMKKPADIASAHVAVGALTLVMTFVLTVRAMRLYGTRSVARDVVAEPVGVFAESAVAA